MRTYQHAIKHGSIAYGWSHEPCSQPLVVLHGLGDSSMHTYAPRFASTDLKDSPTLFIDLPGFGNGVADEDHSGTLEELADNVIKLLQALGVSDAPMFAHSMGANIALIVAARNSSLLRLRILAEPLLDPAESVLAAGIAKYSEDAFISRGYAMLLRATAMQAHRGDVAAEAFMPVLKMAHPRMLYLAATSLLRRRDPDFLSLLQRQREGSHVLIGSESMGASMAIHRAGVGITKIPNAGHFLIADQCYETGCAILNTVNCMYYGGKQG